MNTVTTKAPAAPATRPLRADAARNQQRILEAARELFATRGLEITLDDVAEHAGVGVGTVYRRFSNKQDLIAGVFEKHVDDMAGQAELALDNPDPWQGLVQFFEYMCRHMAENRGLGEVLMTLDGQQNRFACVRERMEPAVTKVIDRARDAGELRPDAEAQDFFATIHMVDWIADFARTVHPEVWRRYFSIMLDGLRADSRPRQPLTVGPMTFEQVHEAKSACFGRRR
ncbi:TetR/AcrR family transcriptional regulator [Antrihabitans spumae]|uniref:TetR/AcrR family transcriptional regulator n=1 Tax=Antrihabitans spumae TaxID=3373370 RepID=A0ABW7KSU8_9NOCA